MTTEFSYAIVDTWDNGEFLSGATLVMFENGEETARETFVGTTEEPPGHSGTELACSAGAAWLEAMTYTLEERLGPFGLEWHRERNGGEVPF